MARALCGAGAAGALTAGIATAADGGWLSAVTMVTASVITLTAVGWWRRDPSRLHRAATTVAVCSGVGTLLTFPGRPIRADSPAAPLMSVEYLAVLGLIFVVTRLFPLRRAASPWLLLGTAGSTLVLRAQVFESFPEAVGQCAFLSVGVLGVGAVGAYLCRLDDQRMNSVQAARRAQRIELARDLHDFVAHDVSGIVVLAQAAQVMSAQQPQQVLALLEQIEAAGQQALKSLDRTVHMLHHTDEGTGPAQAAPNGRPGSYGLDDITEVVDRFRATGQAAVELDLGLAPEAAVQVPREVAGTAHRVIVEALTNIRRHAPTDTDVRIAVEPGGHGGVPGLTVTVTNTLWDEASVGHLNDGGRRGGLGLVGLAERVEALGGTLDAGPYGSGSWRLRAVLPLGAPERPVGPAVA
ncbi:sensor histidine kinase [Kitasatospora sp. NPDC048296]|uniref:sensor histidine kinase n=1 Tax=Kitasatospora sp. NPDC048296 TaxID=3364048 RepID=UPI003722EC0B